MTIGELSSKTGLAVRTLRFYADEGLLPVAGRTASGYRLFDTDAVARAHLVRTLRDLGVGLGAIKRVLGAKASLADVAAEQVRALEAQIALLRVQRAVLVGFVRSSDREELERMTDLAGFGADERRRIVEEYLEAVFGDDPSPVAERMRTGLPELPDDPTDEQVDAWVEIAGLLRDPDFVAAGRAMAARAREEGTGLGGARFDDDGKAVEALAGPALRAGVDPASARALAIVEQLEELGRTSSELRVEVAERIEAFTDRRVGRYWALVAIVNGWAPSAAPEEVVGAWEWYARALRAHAPATSPAPDPPS